MTRDANDLIINLGDTMLSQSDEKCIELFRTLPCMQYYIFGNHESFVHKLYIKGKNDLIDNMVDGPNFEPAEFEDVNIFPLEIEVMYEETEEKNLRIFGYPFKKRLSYKGGGRTVFFGESATFKIVDNKNHNAAHYLYCRHMAPTIWEKMKYDNFVCCCGHSHGNYPKINEDSKEGKIMDCGVDNAMKYNGTPAFTFQEVVKIMKTKNIHKVDHH